MQEASTVYLCSPLNGSTCGHGGSSALCTGVKSALNAAWALLQKLLCMNYSNLGTQLLPITTQRRAAGARDREGRTFFGGFAERILYIDVFAQELNAPRPAEQKSRVRRTQRRPSAEASREDWGAGTTESYMDTCRRRRRLHSFDHVVS